MENGVWFRWIWLCPQIGPRKHNSLSRVQKKNVHHCILFVLYLIFIYTSLQACTHKQVNTCAIHRNTVHIYIYTYIHVCVCLSLCRSADLPACLSVCLSICLSVHASKHWHLGRSRHTVFYVARGVVVKHWDSWDVRCQEIIEIIFLFQYPIADANTERA